MNIDSAILEKLQEKYPEAKNWYEQAKSAKVSLEEYLYRSGKVSPDEVLKIKSAILHFPQIQLADVKIPYEILNLIPENSSRLYQVVAFRQEEQTIYLGGVNPQDPGLDEIIGFLRNSLKLEPKLFVVSVADFYLAFRGYHDFSAELKKFVEEFRQDKPVVDETLTFLGEPVSVEEAPVIKLVETIVREAVNSLASDIHFEPLANKMKIRFRVNGELELIGYLPKDLHNHIINRIKVLARLKLDETRIPQDGRIRVMIEGREIDFRIAILPTIEGEKLTIRILDPLVGLKRLGEIGISKFHERKIHEALNNPYGLALITGPTGSGKTTTLYALLREANKENVNIISLEDPTEYRIEGINQSQVMPEIGYTFLAGLREVLRQDPDIILVGEIRDKETADLAIHSALTGHLVFSTLHTNDALGSITRLIDLGVERFLLAPTLRFLLAQRLARQLCQCRLKVQVRGELEKIVDEALMDLPSGLKEKYRIEKPYSFYQPQGCVRCKQKGFLGRTGIFEIIEINTEIKRALEEARIESDLKKLLANQDFINLRQDGILKALKGEVMLEEVVKIT
jgi:type IV pilus assembly protein PilB